MADVGEALFATITSANQSPEARGLLEHVNQAYHGGIQGVIHGAPPSSRQDLTTLAIYWLVRNLNDHAGKVKTFVVLKAMIRSDYTRENISAWALRNIQLIELNLADE